MLLLDPYRVLVMPARKISPDPILTLLNEGRMSLSDACRAIRKLQGVSQDEFAKRAGVNRKVVKALEVDGGNPRLESLQRIAGSAGLRIAFVADRPPVGLMDSRKRLAEEEARREADTNALKTGVSARELYRRNAMSLGGVRLKLPRIG